MIQELKEITIDHINDLKRRGLSSEAGILLRQRNTWLKNERKNDKRIMKNKEARKLKFKLKQKGICVQCMQNKTNGTVYCKECSIKRDKWYKENQKKVLLKTIY